MGLVGRLPETGKDIFNSFCQDQLPGSSVRGIAAPFDKALFGQCTDSQTDRRGFQFEMPGDIRLVESRVSDKLRKNSPLSAVKADRLRQLIESLSGGATYFVHHENRAVVVAYDALERVLDWLVQHRGKHISETQLVKVFRIFEDPLYDAASGQGTRPRSSKNMVDDALVPSVGSDADSAERPKPLANPVVRRGLIIAAILALLAGGYWYYNRETYGKFQQSTDNAYISADSVTVAPKIAGYVERVLVSENQTVAAGALLVQLDVRDYRAQTSQVEAQIAASLAGADTVRAQQREQDAAIGQARA